MRYFLIDYPVIMQSNIPAFLKEFFPGYLAIIKLIIEYLSDFLLLNYETGFLS